MRNAPPQGWKLRAGRLLASWGSASIVLLVVTGCCRAGIGGEWLTTDVALSEEVGRSREVVDLIESLRLEATRRGDSGRWMGFAERSSKLAETAAALSMERARVLISTASEQERFYSTVTPRVDALSAERQDLVSAVLANLCQDRVSSGGSTHAVFDVFEGNSMDSVE